MERMERRFVELRRKGRELSGVAMPYGETTRVGAGFERFESGAFVFDDVILNVMHDRQRPLVRYPGGGLELVHTPESLRIRAHLPRTQEADDALEMVRTKVYRGLSVEFKALTERYEGRTRIIQSARLGGVGLVDRPQYRGTSIEARRRLGRIKARVPYNKKLACRCKKGCKTAEFKRGAFKQAVSGRREVLAIRGEYADALASKKRGTLVLTDTDEGLEISVDVPDTSAGRDLRELSGATRLIARPVWDDEASGFKVIDESAVVDSAAVRAILIGTTDADDGWPSVAFERATRAAQPAAARERRRLWL